MKWGAWDLDLSTWLWLAWMLWFAVQETIELAARNEPLTAHLRPVFQADPITWFIGVGIWLWLGHHFLLEGLFWHRANSF